MIRAVGLVEFNSIAKGIEVADAMLKTALVTPLLCRTVCPGKFIVLVSGDVAAVESSIRVGVNQGQTALVDEFVLPNVHPSVLAAMTMTTPEVALQALGIIETFSIASLIVAADTAVKTAAVDLLEIRLGIGIGGKSFVTLTGDVAAVAAAVEAGKATVAEKGLLVYHVVIPSPSEQLIPHIV